jgi:hypothetical protein
MKMEKSKPNSDIHKAWFKMVLNSSYEFPPISNKMVGYSEDVSNKITKIGQNIVRKLKKIV